MDVIDGTAASVTDRYPCTHCGEAFPNKFKLGGHVHANHPEHRRTLPFYATRPLIPMRGPRPGGSLKRATDTWPGKP